MTRPFTPRDALRVRRQQVAGTSFEIEDVVLVGQSPLHRAVAASWQLGSGRVATVVLDPNGAGGSHGFIQARRREGAPGEFDLLFIAPALGTGDGNALAWQRLMTGLCQHLGSQGCEHLFATVCEEDTVALQTLRQVGFAVVTGDVVFVHAGASPEVDPPGDVLAVAPCPEHHLAICRILEDALSATARAAAGTWGSDWATYPAGGHAPGPVLSRVCLDGSGTVQGGWRLIAGRSACWLRVVARPGGDAAPLVRHALAARAHEARFRTWPLFSAARGYEPELHLALCEHGFEPRARRFRLVKHLAARVLAPSWHAPGARARGWRRVPSSSGKAPAVRTAGSDTGDTA